MGAIEVVIEPHALERMLERGATKEEIISTVTFGESFPAKFNRAGFRRNFTFDGMWRGRHYATKQLEVLAVEENGRWVVITVIAKYF